VEARRVLLSLATAVLTTVAVGEQSQPAEVWTFVERDGRTITVELRYEVVSDPATSALFAYPGNPFVDFSDDSIYWMDAGDINVKVLDEGLQPRLTFGRPGEGPGEFQFPWAADFDGDSVYVFDRDGNRLNLFR